MSNAWLGGFWDHDFSLGGPSPRDRRRDGLRSHRKGAQSTKEAQSSPRDRGRHGHADRTAREAGRKAASAVSWRQGKVALPGTGPASGSAVSRRGQASRQRPHGQRGSHTDQHVHHTEASGVSNSCPLLLRFQWPQSPAPRSPPTGCCSGSTHISLLFPYLQTVDGKSHFPEVTQGREKGRGDG